MEPKIKLDPNIKLIGSSIVSSINKSTLISFELFCIPINKKINKQELKIVANNVFLINKLILIYNTNQILINIINFAFSYAIFLS